MRMVSAWTDMHRLEIQDNLDDNGEWAKISENIVCTIL